MPIISNTKKEKISEHILSLLFEKYPKPIFTSHIAEEIARDEEFTKILLQDLEKKTFVIPITKNTDGVSYIRRVRWRLSNKAHKAYSEHK